MGAIADHWRRIRENLGKTEEAVAVGIEKNPVTIGVHASLCSTELLELYLHKLGKIPSGKVIKHEWFKRPLPQQKVEPLAERKIGADFPGKEKIYNLMYDIEESRSSLVYGRPTRAQVESVVKSFEQLKEELLKRLEELGERMDE